MDKKALAKFSNFFIRVDVKTVITQFEALPKSSLLEILEYIKGIGYQTDNSLFFVCILEEIMNPVEMISSIFFFQNSVRGHKMMIVTVDNCLSESLGQCPHLIIF